MPELQGAGPPNWNCGPCDMELMVLLDNVGDNELPHSSPTSFRDKTCGQR